MSAQPAPRIISFSLVFSRFISFLEDVVPMKVKSSKKLIGTDDKSNVTNYKYTNLVEICTLCKDDLLFLPKKLARTIGNISRLVLVKNISNVIQVIDPLTGQTGNIESDAYWRDPFRPIITAARTRFTRFVILGKEPVFLERNHSKKAVAKKQRSKLASITAARESDLGQNDSQMEERSHLGYLMKSGDICVGYDLTEAQLVDDEAEELRTDGKLPDFIFVRKLYGGNATGESDVSRNRMFQLQRLDVKKGEEENGRKKKKEKDADMENVDEEDFMQELEADREMRTRVNIYKSNTVGSRNVEDEDEDDDQKVTLDELLDNLVLESKPDEVEMDEDGMGDNLPVFITDGERAARDNLGYVGRDEALGIMPKETATAVSGGWGKEFMDKDGNLL